MSQAKKKSQSVKKSSTSVGIMPLGDRVLIKETQAQQETESGIILPESSSDQGGMHRGKVLAVGPGHMIDGVMQAPDVSVGDTVLFQWGDKTTIDGEEYYIVSASSLIAIVK
jgi:chaperonin GroES